MTWPEHYGLGLGSLELELDVGELIGRICQLDTGQLG